MQNGFQNICVYWKASGMKEDGSSKWTPYEDADCTVKHQHRLLKWKTDPKLGKILLSTIPQANRNALLGDPYKYLANRNVIQMLVEIMDYMR